MRHVMFCAYEQFPYSVLSVVKEVVARPPTPALEQATLSLNLTKLKNKSQGKAVEPEPTEDLSNSRKLQVYISV